MTEKLCNTCNTLKPLVEFGNCTNAKTNFRKGNTLKGKCRDCDAEYAREWRKKHTNYKGSGAITKYPIETRLLVSAIGSRLTDAKQRIKKYNQIPTDLDKEYLYQLFNGQEGKCILSGVELSLNKNNPTTLSLDKIDPNAGCIKGNVQWLAWAVNRAKGDMSTDVFLDMCKKINRKCND